MSDASRRTWFRLASLLHMTVAECQARMSASEYIEWQAYFATEFLGEERADMRTALLLYQQILIHKRKDATMPSIADLMPKWWQPAAAEPEQTMTLADKFRMATGGL